MAEHFKDQETRDKIIAAPNTVKAEDFMKEIKNFDETAWNDVSISTCMALCIGLGKAEGLGRGTALEVWPE